MQKKLLKKQKEHCKLSSKSALLLLSYVIVCNRLREFVIVCNRLREFFTYDKVAVICNARYWLFLCIGCIMVLVKIRYFFLHNTFLSKVLPLGKIPLFFYCYII